MLGTNNDLEKLPGAKAQNCAMFLCPSFGSAEREAKALPADPKPRLGVADMGRGQSLNTEGEAFHSHARPLQPDGDVALVGSNGEAVATWTEGGYSNRIDNLTLQCFQRGRDYGACSQQSLNLFQRQRSIAYDETGFAREIESDWVVTVAHYDS